MPCVKVGSPAV